MRLRWKCGTEEPRGGGQGAWGRGVVVVGDQESLEQTHPVQVSDLSATAPQEHRGFGGQLSLTGVPRAKATTRVTQGAASQAPHPSCRGVGGGEFGAGRGRDAAGPGDFGWFCSDLGFAWRCQEVGMTVGCRRKPTGCPPREGS